MKKFCPNQDCKKEFLDYLSDKISMGLCPQCYEKETGKCSSCGEYGYYFVGSSLEGAMKTICVHCKETGNAEN